MINLDNAYRVTLYINGDYHKPFIQFVKADNMDNAIAKAKNTFEARLYNLGDNGSLAQKCCPLSKEPKKLTFGFQGGHITIHSDNDKTIFEMLDEARNHSFVGGLAIDEITTAISEYM